MKQKFTVLLPAILAVLLVAIGNCPFAQAANVAVNCDARKGNSINAALATLNKSGPNTIRVSGVCNEAVVIQGFDRLTLVGNPTATINDPTPIPDPELEDTTVLNINDSDHVVVQDVTVNGGILGISCGSYSVCTLDDVHVHGSLDTGVAYARSSGVIRDDTVIEDNAGNGLSLVNGSNVFAIPVNTTAGLSIRNNGSGVLVSENSHFTLNGAVQDNGGNGITAERGSNIRVFGAIKDNAGDGLFLRGSTASVRGATITGNNGHGVAVANLALAQFQGPNVIITNGTTDVHCASATTVTVGATGPAGGGGTTDCTEPAP